MVKSEEVKCYGYMDGDTMKKFLFCLFLFSQLSTRYSLLLHAYPPGWSNDILISPDSGGYRYFPDISCDSYNNVWVCWDSANWTNGYIFYTKLDSLGNCIIPETKVSTSTLSRFGRIAVDDADNVHFIWRELSPLGYGLGYAKLRNDGVTIVPAHLVVNGVDGGTPLHFEMALDRQKKLHAVWGECPREYDWIDYTLLDSIGDTLIARIVISDTINGTFSMYAGIGVDSLGNNHIGYRNWNMSERLVYTKVDKNGSILVPETVLASAVGVDLICDNAQNVHIFFLDPNGVGNHIFYIKLDNNGNVLIPPMRVSLPTPWSSGQPHAALDSQQNIHVVWEGDSATQVFPLFYTKLDTSGNFLIPPMKIAYPPYMLGAGSPRIAVDNSDKLHVAWIGVETDGVPRIYYKRGENETTVQEIKKQQNARQNVIKIYPNPFKDKTTISFSIISRGNSIISRGVVKIFNISGQMVRAFKQQRFTGAITWSGTDNNNIELPSGIYFVLFTWEKVQQVVPVIKID